MQATQHRDDQHPIATDFNFEPLPDGYVAIEFFDGPEVAREVVEMLNDRDESKEKHQ